MVWASHPLKKSLNRRSKKCTQASKIWELLTQRTSSRSSVFFFEPYITDRFEAHVTVKLSFFHRCLHTAVRLAPLRYGKIFWCQRCQTSWWCLDLPRWYRHLCYADTWLCSFHVSIKKVDRIVMVPSKCYLNSWFDCLLCLVCNNKDSLCTKCWKQWCKVPASCPWAILCYTWQRSIGCWRKHADSCGFQSSSNRRSCQSHDTSLWNWWVNVVLYLDGHAGVCRCGFQMLFHSFLTCRQEPWLHFVLLHCGV